MSVHRPASGLRPRHCLRLLGVAVAYVLSTGAAHADDFALSLTGGAADGRVDCLDGFACDHHAGVVELGVAYRGVAPFEIQAAYFHVGDLRGADTTPLGTKFGGTFKLDGLAFTAGYRQPILPGLELIARGGAAVVRARFAYDAPFSGEPRDTTAQPYGSLALRYAIAPHWDAGVDYDLTRLKSHVTRGALQWVGASVQFHF